MTNRNSWRTVGVGRLLTDIRPGVLLLLAIMAGCSKSPTQRSTATAQTPLTQKLQAMTPEQRTEYVKTHLDEVAGSAGIQPKK